MKSARFQINITLTLLYTPLVSVGMLCKRQLGNYSVSCAHTSGSHKNRVICIVNMLHREQSYGLMCVITALIRRLSQSQHHMHQDLELFLELRVFIDRLAFLL